MRTENSRGLVSPCINTKKVVCPKRDYPKCMDICEPMLAFKALLMASPIYMSATDCAGALEYPIYFGINTDSGE